MDTGREDVESLLEDHPGLADDLETVAAIDSEGPWEFSDIPLDSGTFGELVSRGVAVEQDSGGYRLENRDAVLAALGREPEDSSGSAEPARSLGLPELGIPVSRQTALVLGGLLALVVVVRVAFVYDAVYRESITLLGNDPYKRLYWVEQLQQYPAFDLGTLGRIPERVRLRGDTLMLVSLWWVSELLGGTADAARLTLAWYPVAAAVITAGTLYATTMKLTDDVRVAGASVLLLAVTPVHAYRTALGFGDHHAFDYIWLGLTVFLVVWWEKELREGRATNQFDSRLLWLVTVGLAVLLTVQSLSWVGSAIHLLPFGALVVVRGAIALYESKSPARATLPYLGGLGLAGLLVLVVHLWLAWFPLSRAVIPLVVVVSATGVIAFLETGRYLSISPRRTLASGLGLTAVTATLVVLTSSLLEPVIQRAIGLFRTRSIAESTGLFSSDVGVVILPILLFGLMLFLAIPFIALGGWRTMKHRDALWAVPVVYAVYFLLWAMVKIRFAGPLSLFTSLFAGWGLVRAAVWVDAARPLSLFDSTESIPRFERPDTQQFFSVLFLFLLVAGLGIVQTPIKQGQLAVDDSTYETSQWLAAYSEDEGMEYPENGVFARWDNTRVYNYFVNGQSNSYGFERRNYDSFLGSTEPGDWYERLRDRYGFVVFTQPRNGTAGPTVENRMRTDENGESTLPTFEHFRLVHTADNGPQQVFELVEGATVVGVQEPNGTASVRTDVPVSGTSRTYERTASPNPYGLYAVTVPYPGDYSADGEQVSISPAAVQDGSRFIQHTREGLLHWPFDEINGSVVYDRVGGFQGHGSNLTVTTDSRRGQAIEFDRSNHSQLATDIQAPSEFTVSTWIKPTALDTTAENDYRNIVRSSAGLFLVLEENGRVSLRLPGTDAKPRAGGNVTLDEWHHVAATYDGTEYVLYLDGSRVGSGTAEGATVSWGGQLRVGTGSIQRHTFDGIIDDFRIYDRALSPEALGEQAAAES